MKSFVIHGETLLEAIVNELQNLSTQEIDELQRYWLPRERIVAVNDPKRTPPVTVAVPMAEIQRAYSDLNKE